MAIRWGVVGGMGPLASAEFVRSIYQARSWTAEQDAPRLILDSDPLCPDRTSLLLAGRQGELASHLETRLTRLRDLGAERFVVCCMTIHQVFPLIPEPLLRQTESLVERTLAAVLKSDRRHLVLCTTGTRACRVLESHGLWPDVQDRLCYPDDEDQRRVHALIYGVKAHADNMAALQWLRGLADRYAVQSLAACCTEFHLLSGRSALLGDGLSWLDPLSMIAADIAAETASTTWVGSGACGS